ncbi:MAG: hypothetical protein VZS44_03535 [Bacilli bacterium]|nr:hypothetical protein [Bacilli bacterium]
MKKEIGKFYAIAFNNNYFEFIVYDDNTMSCPTLGIKSFKTIELKPRFVLKGIGEENNSYIYDAKSNEPDSSHPELIGNYTISEELFSLMKENKMIKYSTDMAYLYGFTDKDGYDNNKYGVGSPYKRAKKKGPILTKQKKGQFN